MSISTSTSLPSIETVRRQREAVRGRVEAKLADVTSRPSACVPLPDEPIDEAAFQRVASLVLALLAAGVDADELLRRLHSPRSLRWSE